MPTMNEIAEQATRICMSLGIRNCLIIIALFILVLLFLFSRSSGWHELADYYPTRNPYQGEWISDEDYEIEVQLRNSVTNAIRIGADGQGLYLSPSLLFRPFHPPIFIPWSDVTAEGFREIPWIKKQNMVKLSFAMAPDAPVYLTPLVAGKVAERSQGQWKTPIEDPPSGTAKGPPW